MKSFLYRIKWSHFHPTANNRFEDLIKNERIPEKQIKSRLEIARMRIVKFAIKTIPFYRKVYKDYGFSIADIGKDGWFEKLLVVTKKELREHFKEWRCRADRRRR